VQYHSDPQGYDWAWGEEFIPRDFADRAERLYDDLLECRIIMVYRNISFEE
jgi:hypothetical protein